MANTRISDLTASASNLASADLAPVVQTAGVGPVKMTGLQLAGGLLGSTTFNGSTVTTSSPVLNLTQTWNDGAGGTVTFTGLKFNATDTASASGSLLLDIGTGGGTYVSKFNVDKSGNVTTENVTARRFIGINTNITVSDQDSRLILSAGSTIQWTSGSTGSTADTTLRRAAAATLQLGAADTTGTTAPTAQFLRVQSWSSSTNNDQTGANFTIQGSRGTGAGAGGSIIFQVAPAGSSGTAQNAYSTALTINSTGKATFKPTVNSTSTFEITNLAGSIIVEVDSTNRRFNAGGSGGAFSVSTSTGATTLYNAAYFGWQDDATASSGTTDVRLYRDTTSTLALRNGGTSGAQVPQTFRVYAFYTDASNYKRLALLSSPYSDGRVEIKAESAGTGGTSDLSLASANGQLYFVTNANTRWNMDTSGHFLAATDNLYDIGASGTSRPRNVYVAGTIRSASSTSFIASGDIQILSGGNLQIASGSNVGCLVDASANGVAVLYDYAGTDFGRLQFGGTTSSFPALKRSSARLQVTDATGAFGQNTGVDTANVAYQGVTFANLPTAAAGIVAYVTDASNAGAAWGDSVTAGGSTNKYLVWYNGTNWTVIGK